MMMMMMMMMMWRRLCLCRPGGAVGIQGMFEAPQTLLYYTCKAYLHDPPCGLSRRTRPWTGRVV
jgi:hypothetical protein